MRDVKDLKEAPGLPFSPPTLGQQIGRMCLGYKDLYRGEKKGESFLETMFNSFTVCITIKPT